MKSSSYIEISKSALQSNLHLIRSLIGPNCRFSSVVKGNAYGHGLNEFIRLAEEFDVNHFSVFCATEAMQVRKISSKNSDVLVMGLLNQDEIEWAIANNVAFFVFDVERLQKVVKIAAKLKKQAKIHIEIETGLNRTGFCPNELPAVLAIVKTNLKHLLIQGICTHLAGAESISNYHRIKIQTQKFNKSIKWFDKNGIQFPVKHMACSAAIINYPKTNMDMVRIGIMQYGLWSNKETMMQYLSNKKDRTDPLKRIISWKSTVMSIKNIEVGEFVGYGTNFLAETKMKIAIVPVGYSDGYNRALSNQGKVLINGQRINVIGTINMNMLAADITNIANVKHGDEVVLIGNQHDLSVSIASFSELSNQLNYELLTRLPSDIPRIITK